MFLPQLGRYFLMQRPLPGGYEIVGTWCRVKVRRFVECQDSTVDVRQEKYDGIEWQVCPAVHSIVMACPERSEGWRKMTYNMPILGFGTSMIFALCNGTAEEPPPPISVLQQCSAALCQIGTWVLSLLLFFSVSVQKKPNLGRIQSPGYILKQRQGGKI